VLIEARILEARIAKGYSYGIDWSMILDSGRGNAAMEDFASPTDSSHENLFVTWGKGDFSLAIEAMENVEGLNTLAAPRVLAIDGVEAEIIIGGELGFSVVSVIDNTVVQSVEFLDTGALLRITPTIASDGFIRMSIHPELSDGVIQEGLPSKTTAEVTTDVLIRDGDTLLIGGLIRERNETIRKGIPILKNIPLLGMLFGKKSKQVQKSELIALITPHILAPGETVAYDTP